jgi:hypothetical protein
MASYIGRGMQHKPLDQTNLKNSVVASLEAVGNRCTKERLTHGSHMLSGIRVGPPGPTWKPLGLRFDNSPSRVFSHRFLHGSNIFLFRAPNIANNISISIVSTSSSQWYTPIHHLGYFYLVKN